MRIERREIFIVLLRAATLFTICVILSVFVLLMCGKTTARAEEGMPYISELMASVATRDPDSGFDWLEICNPGKRKADLSGWQIRRAKKEAYTFPKGTYVNGGDVLLVYCDEAGGKRSGGINVPFSLKTGGDTIVLIDPEGHIADTFTYPAQYGNISCGRLTTDGEILYLERSTPGKINSGKGYSSRSDAPLLNLQGGRYGESIQVQCESGAGETRYTLGGGTVTTASRLFPEEGITVTENTALRVRCFEEGKLPSAMTSATYIIGFETDCPVVSLITDPEYLTGPNGLFVDGTNPEIPNYKQNWEYPMYVEYAQTEGAASLAQDIGFRIMGEVSRKYKQKAMVLTARKAYSGTDRLYFFPFQTGEAMQIDAFKAIALRSAGSEDATDGVRFRDAFLVSLAEGYNVLYQSNRPAVVFMNGELFGHYNIREKVNRYFIAAHEGITDTDVIDRIDILQRTGEVMHGSNAEYLSLRSFVKKNDLNVPENLQYVLDRVDIDSYFDHCAFEIICGNEDINNIKFYKVPGGKWKWILYDFDTAMLHMNNRPLEWLMVDKKTAPQHDFDHFLFSALMEVPEMRQKFLTRAGQILAQRFTPDFLNERLDEWVAVYTPIMQYQFKARPGMTKANWEKGISVFRKQLTVWPKHSVQLMQKYFHLTDEEVQQYFGAFLDRCN